MPWQTIGQEPARRMLARGVEAERPSHAYLFTGPANCGKTTLALDFACALLCTGEPKPCDQCPNCREVRRGRHPDVEQVEREEKERSEFEALWAAKVPERPRQALTIDRARDLIRVVALRPTQARYRVAMLDGSAIQDTAASALLKLFEEPAERTILVLRADAVEAVPVPIASRCQLVRLGPVPTFTIVAWLQKELGLDADRARSCAALSSGRPGLARRLAESDEAVPALEEQAARWLAIAMGGSTLSRHELAAQWGRGYPVARAALDLAGVVWRDLLRCAAHGEGGPVLETLRSPAGERLAAQGLWVLGHQLSAIARASRLLDANVQPRLVLDWLFLSLAGSERLGAV